jgi:hypothetical protein
MARTARQVLGFVRSGTGGVRHECFLGRVSAGEASLTRPAGWVHEAETP